MPRIVPQYYSPSLTGLPKERAVNPVQELMTLTGARWGFFGKDAFSDPVFAEDLDDPPPSVLAAAGQVLAGLHDQAEVFLPPVQRGTRAMGFRDLATGRCFGVIGVANHLDEEALPLLSRFLRYRPAPLQIQQIHSGQLLRSVMSDVLNASPEQRRPAIEGAMERLGTTVGADRVFLVHLQEPPEVPLTFEWTAEDQLPWLTRHKEIGELIDQEIRNGQILVIRDPQEIPPGAFRAALTAWDVGSQIIFPMVIEGKLVGYAGVESAQPNRNWNPELRWLLQGLLAIETLTTGPEALHAPQSTDNIGALADSLPQLIFMWDRRHESLLSANRSSSEFPELQMNDEWPKGLLEHLPDADGERLMKQLRSPSPAESTFPITVGEQTRWVHLRTLPLTGSDSTTVGVIEDVTNRRLFQRHLLETQDELERRIRERTVALRLTEQRFQALAETISVTVMVFNHMGQVVYANPAAEMMFGFNPSEMTREQLVKRLSVQPTGLLQLVRERGLRVHRELAIQRGDEVMFLDVHAARLPHGDDLVVTATDVTNRHDNEASQRDRFDEISRQSRATILTEIASSLGHELNQPLTAILNFAQGSLLRLSQPVIDRESLEEAIEKVSEEAKRAGEIVHRLRALFRRHLPDLAPVSLQDLLRQVYDLHSFDFRRHHIDASLNPDPDVPEVEVDARQIELALINLVRNAVNAMTEGWDGPRKLVLGLEHQGNYAVLNVTDSGKPINPLATNRMYDSFFTTRQEGTGMGLFISQTIAERHGGSLWYEVRQNGTKTFFLSIPLRSE